MSLLICITGLTEKIRKREKHQERRKKNTVSKIVALSLYVLPKIYTNDVQNRQEKTEKMRVYA